jgi:hypothetical protein
MSAIWPVTDDERWAEQSHKVLGLLMDGLRHGVAR